PPYDSRYVAVGTFTSLSDSLLAKLSLIILGRLVCESSSPFLALCLCAHTRGNKPETKLHRLPRSAFPMVSQKIL
ncbi:hypothetical protein, partial [Salmonella enterica]|uniref:hypothetical protein n=1 Tax=Salmonella enterica TaxID=28901 RepID=UPI003EDBAC3D